MTMEFHSTSQELLKEVGVMEEALAALPPPSYILPTVTSQMQEQKVSPGAGRQFPLPLPGGGCWVGSVGGSREVWGLRCLPGPTQNSGGSSGLAGQVPCGWRLLSLEAGPGAGAGRRSRLPSGPLGPRSECFGLWGRGGGGT